MVCMKRLKVVQNAHSERSSQGVTKIHRIPLSSACPSREWSRKLFNQRQSWKGAHACGRAELQLEIIFKKNLERVDIYRNKCSENYSGMAYCTCTICTAKCSAADLWKQISIMSQVKTKFLHLEKATMAINRVVYSPYPYWVELGVSGLHFRMELEWGRLRQELESPSKKVFKKRVDDLLLGVTEGMLILASGRRGFLQMYLGCPNGCVDFQGVCNASFQAHDNTGVLYHLLPNTRSQF